MTVTWFCCCDAGAAFVLLSLNIDPVELPLAGSLAAWIVFWGLSAVARHLGPIRIATKYPKKTSELNGPPQGKVQTSRHIRFRPHTNKVVSKPAPLI